jgi:hypothetical protein
MKSYEKLILAGVIICLAVILAKPHIYLLLLR